MMNDYWLVLMLLMASNTERISMINEEYEHQKYLQRNCPYIKWEQDMNATIPFCKSTNDICDLHCLRDDDKWRYLWQQF